MKAFNRQLQQLPDAIAHAPLPRGSPSRMEPKLQSARQPPFAVQIVSLFGNRLLIVSQMLIMPFNWRTPLVFTRAIALRLGVLMGVIQIIARGAVLLRLFDRHAFSPIRRR